MMRAQPVIELEGRFDVLYQLTPESDRGKVDKGYGT
jgi:hypothetical protein